MEGKKLEVKDAAELDKRVPRNLIIMFQGKPYIEKAGLEWKANLLFGGGNYGVTTEIVEKSPDMVLAKATFTTSKGICFSNYGEASKANVSNPAMQKYLIHLAITRAECRVLRMATACGYTSVDEMDRSAAQEKEIPVSDTDNEPPTASQMETLSNHPEYQPTTQREAKEMIADMMRSKK